MKAEEIKPCALCGKRLMECGSPIFYRVAVQAMGVDIAAVRQQAGLEQFFGGGGGAAVALARVFSPDPEIAKTLGMPHESLVCQSCSTQPHLLCRLAGES